MAGVQRDGDLDLVLYTGKGGVGKTTTAAATAARAAELGQRTLLVSADAAHSLADVLQRPLASPRCAPGDAGSDPGAPLAALEVASKLFAAELDAGALVARHWTRIHDYLGELFTHHGVERAVASELATLPGAYELAALLAVERCVASGAYDLVVVDCAPTASALRMATLPDVARGMLGLALSVLRSVSGLATPLAQRWIAAPLPEAELFESIQSLLYRELSALRQRLVAPSTAVRLVVTPERMVIDEALRAYTDLCLFEVSVDAVVVNRVLDPNAPEADTDPFLVGWIEVQAQRLAEIEVGFAPLPILQAPWREEEVLGLAQLRGLGEAIFGTRPPGGRLAPAAANLRFSGAAKAPVLHLPLPGVAPDALEVALVEGNLVLTTERRRRAIPLPRRVARLELGSARLAAGELSVEFSAQGSPRCG